MKTQVEIMKMVRKPASPGTRIIRPKKGGGYRRNGKHKAPEFISCLDHYTRENYG